MDEVLVPELGWELEEMSVPELGREWGWEWEEMLLVWLRA